MRLPWDRLRRYRTAEANVVRGGRMHAADQFAEHLLVEQQRPNHLDAAAGRAGAGREAAEEEQPQPQ
jgi:hypothetical protein